MGAGFLLLMGLYTLFFKKISIDKDAEAGEKQISKRGLVGIFVAGFLMNTLNPNVFLFWFAWTAAIGTSAAEVSNPLYYKLLVFGTCLLFVLLSDLAKVALAGRLRPRLTDKILLWVNRIAGIIILIFSAALFYSAINY